MVSGLMASPPACGPTYQCAIRPPACSAKSGKAGGAAAGQHLVVVGQDSMCDRPLQPDDPGPGPGPLRADFRGLRPSLRYFARFHGNLLSLRSAVEWEQLPSAGGPVLAAGARRPL